MCNYFSIGIESRIGLGFDKQRTGNATFNKVCYGWEGLKKICCGGKTKRIKDVVDYVTTRDPESGEPKIIFACDKKTESENYIRGNPVSFVCTNINSMMGGQTNMWASGKGQDLGLIDAKG